MIEDELLAPLDFTDEAFDADGRVLAVGDLVEDVDNLDGEILGRITDVHDFETGRKCFVTVHSNHAQMIYITGRSCLWRWIDPAGAKAKTYVPSIKAPGAPTVC